MNGAEEHRRRDDALADCDRLLADAARVMRDARAVSQRLRDDTLAEVETQASRLIAEAEQARDAIIGDARRIRDEVLAEADAEAERRQAETEQALLAAVAAAETRARELREEAAAHAREVRDRAFRQHCILFHQRPLLWQIWDGLKDGFSVFVHYHRFTQANLRKLTYTMLGDWLARLPHGLDTRLERRRP